MKTILTPNTSPDRKQGLYVRVPIKPVPATEQNLSSWAAGWNEGRDPETVLSVAERRARRVLEGEGVGVLTLPPKRIRRGFTLVGVPGGCIVRKTHEKDIEDEDGKERWKEVGPALSERAEVAIAVLWAAFAARESMKKGDLASAVVEAVYVGTLSERMLVLPFEAEVVRLASNRRKGTEANSKNSAARRREKALRVEALVAQANTVTRACAIAAQEWAEREGMKNPNWKSLVETFRFAYREVFPAKPRD
jgi:hypothetical protein